jgi:hypothetical protein
MRAAGTSNSKTTLETLTCWCRTSPCALPQGDANFGFRCTRIEISPAQVNPVTASRDQGDVQALCGTPAILANPEIGKWNLL